MPKKSRKPLADTSYFRKELLRLLPEMLSDAVQSYDRITRPPAEECPKNFIAQHGAAKAALTHIEHLLKLAQWLSDSIHEGQEGSELEKLINSARQALEDEEKAQNRTKGVPQ